ncbi:uncharacterized protein EI97DRAFT_492868 [Westerdykella ornata]|uniref:ELYS-like domain-containing protein n=1 Tax=Westerdykella ornata TaxID=318751 RepID=A0A6A6JP40_WESOR|nr:uncharacterized protein EI97DRAFT_492868 [Westerdykella ornata]KAF2278391.1 hypothetical protein EI97DRAFT_492868 [Westerdykella ornata]
MLDADDFASVFPDDIAYDNELIEEIQENKKSLGGRTFFERLLELLQIKSVRRAYPPPTPSHLEKLHEAIVSAPIAQHYKHSLLFYLLKDLDGAYEGETELSTTFARRVQLAPRFWTFVEGLWALDHLDCRTAVARLTHPSIIPTFPDEIMLVLLSRAAAGQQGRRRGVGATAREGREREREGEDVSVLPLAYYDCANPPLVGQQIKVEFVRYLAARSVTETFYWIRARPEQEQRVLLEVLVKETLDRHAWDEEEEAGEGQDGAATYSREERAVELVGLPFTEEEEEWVESYLTEGKGRTLRGAADTVQMRRIATGRLEKVVAEGMAKGRKYEQVNWEVLRDGIKRGLGPRGELEGMGLSA